MAYPFRGCSQSLLAEACFHIDHIKDLKFKPDNSGYIHSPYLVFPEQIVPIYSFQTIFFVKGCLLGKSKS